jgi:hypothetical protein
MLLNLPAPMTPTRTGLPSPALAWSIRYRFMAFLLADWVTVVRRPMGQTKLSIYLYITRVAMINSFHIFSFGSVFSHHDCFY